MGLTHDEITGCTITRCQGIDISGSHSYYVFGVVDADGFNYDWKDKLSVSGLTGSSINNVIYNHLSTGMTKQVVISQVVVDDPSVIGQPPIQP